jgi:hypothetical protein
VMILQRLRIFLPGSVTHCLRVSEHGAELTAAQNSLNTLRSNQIMMKITAITSAM